jgi:hypothetical protein
LWYIHPHNTETILEEAFSIPDAVLSTSANDNGIGKYQSLECGHRSGTETSEFSAPVNKGKAITVTSRTRPIGL